jgi:transposase
MYQSGLSDEEWMLVSHHFEHKDPRGKKPIHSKCAIVNAILYISKSGAQWRWSQRGVWEAALDEINEIHRKETAKSQPLLWGL